MPRRLINRAAIHRLTRGRGVRIGPRALERLEQRLIAFVAAQVAQYDHAHPRLRVDRIEAEGEDPPVLIVNGKCVRPGRTLGQGTYGSVFKYVVGGEGVAVKVEVLKSPKSATRPPAALVRSAEGRRLATCDSEAAQILDEALGGRSGGLLGIRYLGLHLYGEAGAAHLYSMPIMEGSLGDKGALDTLIERFRRPGDSTAAGPAVLRIVELIRRQAVLLMQLDQRLCYTDMKLNNVLYRLRGGTPEVWLCDFGSAMVDNEDEYTFTYPNPPSGKPFQPLPTLHDRQAALAYQIGVLLATCIGINVIRYSHDHCSIPLDSTPLQVELARAYDGALAALVAPDPYSRRAVTVPLIK
jgi:hypothetical protein